MQNKFKIPDIIFLQCHDDDGELFDVDGEEVTWCEDDVDGHNIKYVRKDAILTKKFSGQQPLGRMWNCPKCGTGYSEKSDALDCCR